MEKSFIFNIESHSECKYHTTIKVKEEEFQSIIAKREIPAKNIFFAEKYLKDHYKTYHITKVSIFYNENGIEKELYFEELVDYFNSLVKNDE